MTHAPLQANRSWWPQHVMLGWLNLALTAPGIYLYIGLPMVMRQHGWSVMQIGMFQLAGLPAMFKFAFAGAIDRWPCGRTSYRNWALVLCAGHAAVLLVLGANDLRSSPDSVLFLLAMLVSLFSTWADVPVNALAIQILPESEWIRAGAIRSSVTSLGAIVGGGLMLMLQTRMGWAAPFQILALGGLSMIVLLPCLPVRTATASVSTVVGEPRAGLQQWIGWFAVPEHRVWGVLLVLYFPLIGTVWVYLKPLMLDRGLPPERIALVVGVGGGLIAALASLAGGHLSRRIGLRAALSLFAACNLLALSLLAAATISGFGTNTLITAAMIVAFMMGASGGLIFGLMMYPVRPGLMAMDYGIQSSLFVMGRTLLPVLMGMLLDHLGYPGMFGCLLTGLGLLLAFLLVQQRRSKASDVTATSRDGKSMEATVPPTA